MNFKTFIATTPMSYSATFSRAFLSSHLNKNFKPTTTTNIKLHFGELKWVIQSKGRPVYKPSIILYGTVMDCRMFKINFNVLTHYIWN